MRWQGPLVGFVLLIACKDKEPRSAASRTVAGDAVLSDVLPPDAPHSSRFLDLDGAPSEDILSFCRASKPKTHEIEPNAFLDRYLGGACRLSIFGPLTAELIPLLRGIAKSRRPAFAKQFPIDPMWDEGRIVDHRHQLTMSFNIVPNDERVFVFWEPYQDPEAIIGINGRLLAGLDIAQVLGRSPTSLRKAISGEYELDGCDETKCVAYGPRLAEGYPTSIEYRPGRLIVSISTKSYNPRLWVRVRELVSASLGPGQQHGADTNFVFVKDAVRYVWHESDGTGIEIAIEKM